MGIGFVLIFWVLAGGALAGTGAFALGSAAAYVTRGARKGRKRVILAIGAFPFMCLAWAGTVFIFQAVINETVFHRDAGLGDTWRCPLPNGYALMMIDTPDEGWVYNPQTQPGDAVGEREDAVSDVRMIQMAGRYILGTSDTERHGRFGDNSNQVHSFFILDTQTGTHRNLSSYEALTVEAQKLGIRPELVTIDTLYSKYRFTGFDIFVGFLFFLPPVAALYLLMKWLAQVRRTRTSAIQTA